LFAGAKRRRPFFSASKFGGIKYKRKITLDLGDCPDMSGRFPGLNREESALY